MSEKKEWENEKWFDVLVMINNPARLDQEVQRYGALCIQDPWTKEYRKVDGCYVVRTTMPRSIQAIIEKERGTVVRVLDELL